MLRFSAKNGGEYLHHQPKTARMPPRSWRVNGGAVLRLSAALPIRVPLPPPSPEEPRRLLNRRGPGHSHGRRPGWSSDPTLGGKLLEHCSRFVRVAGEPQCGNWHCSRSRQLLRQFPVRRRHGPESPPSACGCPCATRVRTLTCKHTETAAPREFGGPATRTSREQGA